MEPIVVMCAGMVVFLSGVIAGEKIERKRQSPPPTEDDRFAAVVNETFHGASPRVTKNIQRILSKPISTVKIRTAIVWCDEE